MVAYSTVGQLGYMFLLLPLSSTGGDAGALGWGGAVYFGVAHGCAKAAVFLAAGALLLGLGHDRVDGLAGTAERYPLVVMALAVAGVNLMGLPPSGGFVAKWMLLKAAVNTGQWWYVPVILSGGLLAAAYVFRVLEQTLAPAGDTPEGRPLGPGLQVPVLVLALVAAGLGVLSALPFTLLDVGAPAPVGPLPPGTAEPLAGGAW